MRIDAHHHLWDLRRRPQPWLDGPWADPIRRTWTEDDLAPQLDAYGIDATVVVQACSSLAETRELLALKEQSSRIAAVVGWTDLTGAHDPVLPPGLAGIRHQVQDEPDPEWLSRPDVRHSLHRLAQTGLVYELLVTPRELPAAIAAVRDVPQLRFVLDHAAKPPVAAGEWQPWASLLADLAAFPNVSCKLSGLVTEADWTGRRAADVLPYARYALDVFGPERILFGSDWPVCELAAPYGQVYELADRATGHLTAAERAAVFGANAARVYGIGTA